MPSCKSLAQLFADICKCLFSSQTIKSRCKFKSNQKILLTKNACMDPLKVCTNFQVSRTSLSLENLTNRRSSRSSRRRRNGLYKSRGSHMHSSRTNLVNCLKYTVLYPSYKVYSNKNWKFLAFSRKYHAWVSKKRWKNLAKLKMTKTDRTRRIVTGLSVQLNIYFFRKY